MHIFTLKAFPYFSAKGEKGKGKKKKSSYNHWRGRGKKIIIQPSEGNIGKGKKHIKWMGREKAY